MLWARLKSRDGDESAWAAAHLEEALAHEPNSPEARLWRGRLWIAEGRLREAEQELTGALAARPMDPRYLLVMGTLVYTLASHRVITTLDAVGARRSESPVVEARLRCFLAHEKAAGDGAPMRAEKCFDPLRR